MKKARLIEGVWINPELPKDFDCTPNEDRTEDHLKWWGVPYVVERLQGDGKTRFDVRCLDGGAWDRSTWKGSFETLEEAVNFAKSIKK